MRDVSVLSEWERQRLLVEWNETREEYANERCLHELIEEQAVGHRSALALIVHGRERTVA